MIDDPSENMHTLYRTNYFPQELEITNLMKKQEEAKRAAAVKERKEEIESQVILSSC